MTDSSESQAPPKPSFWRSVFSESDGTGSSSRVISAFLAVMTAVWISYVVFHEHHLPDAVTAGGLAALSTSHYVANKFAGAFGKQQS